MSRAVVLSFLLVFSVSAFASLTVSQPISGTTVSNPVRITASDPEATTFRVYVDNVAQFSASGTSINTALSVSSGQRNIVIQTWDRNGAVEKFALTVNAQASTLAQSLPNLEESIWGNCGTCGNHIGDTRYVVGGQKIGYSPALRGKSSKFFVGGDNPYTNYYWFLKTNWYQKVSRIKLTLDLFVPSGSDPQAIEFENQYRWKGYLYNLSIQLGYKSHRCRTFDFINKVWKDTGIPFTPLNPDTWHHLETEWEIDHSSHRRKLVSVSVDGNRKTPIYAIYMPARVESGLPDYMTIAAFQLDMNSSAQDYSVFVDNYTFHYE
jgi:hypothetical protein